MKKVIELALKSGEITIQGVINLVNCLSDYKQERAVMLLTESNNTPDGVNILDKGIVLNSKGNVTRTYQCVGYNYLEDNVIVKTQIDGKDELYNVGVYRWREYRQNYIKQQQKECEEYVRKQQELQ